MPGEFRVENGVCAIWEGLQDDDPFYDPLNNLSRLKFHSALDYTKIISVHPITYTFPSFTAGHHRAQTYQMFAHGQPHIPWVWGRIIAAGHPVAFSGSIPVQKPAGQDLAQWLSLGADATHVWIHEYLCKSYYPNATLHATAAAITVSMEIYITDEVLP